MDYISLIVAIVSAFVAVVTLIATIIIGRMQVKQNNKIDERDERRHSDMIYSDATKFILKYSPSNYNSEIYLLPLWIMAYKYNPIYPYRREIYREFCSLTEEIQNCILERADIEIKSCKAEDFYRKMLENLKQDIKKNYPDDNDLYYENGKYFEDALRHHGNRKVPDIQCNADSYYAGLLKQMADEYNKNTMNYESHIANLLVYEKSNRPIKKLMEESTSIGIPIDINTDEILISYLSCMISKYVACYSHSNGKYENIGCVEDFQGERYMEDLFLEALFETFIYQ